MKRLIAAICILITCNAFAQNGWEKISRNDFLAAREAFQNTLKKDSTDKQSLLGMIFIAEVMRDKLSYQKCINSLINNHKQAEHLLLFRNQYTYNKNLKDLSGDTYKSAASLLKYFEANNLFYQKKYSQSISALREITSDFNWNIIGPFSNLEGYGYVDKMFPEIHEFNPDTAYKDVSGSELKWLKTTLRNPSGIMNFEDFLNTSYYDDAVYYACTFVKVDTDKDLQMRISRNTPMKIWIDNELVFSNRDQMNFEWDSEIVKLRLKSGTHKILVKCATMPNDVDYSSLLSYRDKSYTNYSEDDFNISSLFGNQSSYDVKFLIRFTDAVGNLINFPSSAYEKTYEKQTLQPELINNMLVKTIEDRIQNNPNDLSLYYLLNKANILSKKSIECEEFFVKKLRENPSSLFFSYLAAKIYAFNKKSEKTYTLLKDLDNSKIRIYALDDENLQKINKDTYEKKYFAALKDMDSVYPYNLSVIYDMVDYYISKGQNEVKKDYVKKKIALYPSYKEDLEEYLEDDNNRPSDYKPETDKERAKEAKLAAQKLKNNFSTDDYLTLIEYYEDMDKPKKALALYDELISIQPYIADNYMDKADLLYEKERYNDAVTELEKMLNLTPYSADVYEKLGDIFSDKKEKEKALSYYTQAIKLASSYSKEDIRTKMNKLKDKEVYKDYFVTKSFEEVLSSLKWENKYEGENSVVLMYTRDVCLDKDNETHYYQKLMIQILNDDGARQWTDYDFSFMGDLNFVKVIKQNGAIVTPDQNYGYVVFKDLKPGDIIQMEGTYDSYVDNEFNNQFFMISYLSFKAPVNYAKLDIMVPQGKKFYYDLNKLKDVVEKKSSKGYDYYKWEYNNIAKYEEEDAILDKIDPYSYVWVTTDNDWSNYADWYIRKTYRMTDLTYEIREILDTIITKTMNTQEKVNTVFEFITKQINYSYVSFMQSKHVPKRPALTCSGAIGDCKDVATLMITMLRELGIESYYVLVKTNTYFHRNLLPTLLFDHVIVAYYIDGKIQYADPTSNYYPCNSLPENDASAFALLIKEGTRDLFILPNDHIDTLKNMQHIEINAKLSEQKTLSLNLKVTSNGVEGGSLREDMNTKTIDEQKKFITGYFGEEVMENLIVEDFNFGNIKESSTPLVSTFSLKVEGYGDKLLSLLIFRVPFVKAILGSNAIKKDIRNNTIDLSEILSVTPVTQKLRFEIPNGYKLLDIPENVSIKSKFGRYELNFSVKGNIIEVEKVQIFYDSRVLPEDFEAFKNYYLKILEADRTKLAIQKEKKKQL